MANDPLSRDVPRAANSLGALLGALPQRRADRLSADAPRL